MNVAHQRRLRQREQVVIAAQLSRPVTETRAAVVLLGKARALDHRAHRAVEEQDALAEQRLQLRVLHVRHYDSIEKEKGPLSLRRNGPLATRVSLAEFVRRPAS